MAQVLTDCQRRVIETVNHLYEDCRYRQVTITDVFTASDLTFEEIHEAIRTHPMLDADRDGNITSCPDRKMMESETRS